MDEALQSPELTAKKLHNSLGHPPAERLITTVKSALVNKEPVLVKSLMDAIRNYSINCQSCLMNQKPVPRPKITLPNAIIVNDVLAMDVTFWSNPNDSTKLYPILHMIDLATRFSSACLINNVDADVVIHGFVRYWLCLFGAPRRVWLDNGKEFANDKLVELLERHGTTVKATAAESPYMNGICERHNLVVKNIMSKVACDRPDVNLSQLIGYALYAKNVLTDNKGFSPFQRIFG